MNDEDELRSAPPATLDVEVCRALPQPIELRADADGADGEERDGPGTMVGHFSVFNHWYHIRSWVEGEFMERLAPGAFKRTIKNRNGDTPVRVLLEHGYDPQVGDKPLGVPEILEERDNGPYAEVPLFDTSYNRDLAPALVAGAYGQSFRMQVLRDEWVEEPGASDHNPKGIPERTIKEVRLIEFGPTVFPANPAADAGLRSTTDTYYERLRSKDPARYDAALESVRSRRAPAPAPAGTPPTEDPQAQHSEDPQTRSVEHSEDPQAQHSEDPSNTSSTQNRSNPMDENLTIEERRARQSEIRSRLTEIDTEFAGAELPEEQRAEWDELNTELDTHDRAIADQEARRARLAEIAEEDATATRSAQTSGRSTERPRNRTAAGLARRPENIYDLSAIRQQARSIDDLPALYRDNAMRAIEVARFPGVEDREASQAYAERLLQRVDDEDGTLARRILATGSPVYERAFGKVAQAQNTLGLTTEEQRALSLGTDANGGFAVPFDLDPTIILTSSGVVDPLREISRVEQIVGKEWQGVSSTGVTATRAAEAAEAADGAPTLDDPVVRAQRVHAFIPFSIELELSWSSMRSELTGLLTEAKADEEATSFILGDGTGTNANGIVGTLDSGSHVDAAGEAIVVGDLYAVEEDLGPRFRQRARWLANRSIYNKVRQLDTAGGANLWERLANGLPPELLGYPAHEASAMDGTINAAATGTNLVLLFGDFSKFLIVDRIGMNIELVPHLLGSNRRPTGQRGLYAIWHNNSKVLTDNAFRLLKVSTTA